VTADRAERLRKAEIVSDVTSARKSVRVTGKERAGLAKQLRTGYEKGASIRALAETSGKSYGSGVSLRARGGPTRGTARTAEVGQSARRSA
jgi:hypothetical protein